MVWGRVRVLVLAALVGSLALAACGDRNIGVRLETTVDTVGGVVHVRHTGSARDRALERVLELGTVGTLTGTPSPAEFGRIARVMADGHGRVYVADQIPPEIRVFGPGGEHLRTIGREGAGPGELAGLYGMEWLAPDTMFVVDPGNARLAALTTTGEQVRQWRWARLSGPAEMFLFNGGASEAYAYAVVPGERGGARLGSVWVRYTLHRAPDTLSIPSETSLNVQLPTNARVCRDGGGIGVRSNEYAPSLVRVPAPGLERAVAVSSEYEISFIDPVGDTVRVLSRSVPPVPLPDSLRARVDSANQAFRADWRGADCEGEVAETDHLPVLRDLYFDHAGRLLVEYNRPEGVAFDLFDRDGGWIATFPAPDRDTSVPPYLYDDRLYTVTRDTLDVQRVHVHRLVDPAR